MINARKIIGLCLVWGVGLGTVEGLWASDHSYRLYGVSSKREDVSDGVGFRANLRRQQLKFEITEDFLRYAHTHSRRLPARWYQRSGVNYLHERMYAPDNSKTRISQYAGAVALGYRAKNSLLAEWGVGWSYIDGGDVGARYNMASELSRRSYMALGKRFEGGLGTLDLQGRVKYLYRVNGRAPSQWQLQLGYYPQRSNSRLSLRYHGQSERTELKLWHKWYFARYTYRPEGEPDWRLGMKVRFRRFLSPRTWHKPQHRANGLALAANFQQLVMKTHHRVQSQGGIKRR